MIWLNKSISKLRRHHQLDLSNMKVFGAWPMLSLCIGFLNPDKEEAKEHFAYADIFFKRAVDEIQPLNDRVYFLKWYLKGLGRPLRGGAFVSWYVDLDFRSSCQVSQLDARGAPNDRTRAY